MNQIEKAKSESREMKYCKRRLKKIYPNASKEWIEFMSGMILVICLMGEMK